MTSWPHAYNSMWPPSAAVRQLAISASAFFCSCVSRPPCASRNARPCLRTTSAMPKRGRSIDQRVNKSSGLFVAVTSTRETW